MKNVLEKVAIESLIYEVKRNRKRFPEDFMFQLSHEEFTILMSQIVTSSWGGIRKMPYVFTEQGVAMLSSVLRSEEAINDLSEDMRQEIDTIYQGSNEKVGWKVEAPPEGLALPALCR